MDRRIQRRAGTEIVGLKKRSRNRDSWLEERNNERRCELPMSGIEIIG